MSNNQSIQKIINEYQIKLSIILDSINISLEISTIEFSDDQSIIWEEIGKYYISFQNYFNTFW